MTQNKRAFLFGILVLQSVLFLAILRLNYYSIIFPVFFSILGMILFITIDWFSESDPKGEKEIEQEVSSSKNLNFPVSSKILTILFLFFFSLSLLSLFQGEYTKTVAYYLCISLCAGILIIEILTYRTHIQRYGILLKTLLLSINIVFANHLIFIHGISLPDFSLHFNVFYMSILDTGHLSNNPIGPYGIFSIHHIFASSGAILTGYNPQSVYLLFGSFIIAIGVLFVFLVGKRFVNFQFGLVAALLFTCLDYYLMYGEHPEHQAYNFGFALICFTIIMYTYRFQKPAFYILFALSAVAMTLTHHLSAAIVFITVFSLLILDIYHIIQKRELSLPSKYITAITVILFFAIIFLMSNNSPVMFMSNNTINPYFNDITFLLRDFFAAPAPEISIPVTYNPISPPTEYDKLSFITLFENTLGSSLLVLLAVLGFCSFIKKRTWFGGFTIIYGFLLSFLLGIGIILSLGFLLPDRLYPSLQIFSLVFLGAFGILWLNNAVSARKKTLIIGCICILIAMMSFLSLASIINGFETSPLIGEDVAYWKAYTTSQDTSFGEWRNTFAPVNSDMVFDRTLIKTGIIKIGNKFGQHSFTKFNSGQLTLDNSFSSYYDNGLIVMMNNTP